MNAIATQPQSAPITFGIPTREEDLAEFRRLPETVRNDIRRYLAAFQRISEAINVSTGCRAQAMQLSAYRGFSFDRLRSLYYAYLRTGDWRVLKNNSKAKAQTKVDKTNLPPEFLDFWRGRCGYNQKASLPAYRQLKRDWRSGVSIPGYGTWQEYFQQNNPYMPLPLTCPPDLPEGWSESNLYRMLPTDAELALSRRGIAIARQHLPDILRTRVGLRPLELVAFDDVRTDFRIIVAGCPMPVELHLLVAIDVASGKILRYGLRPAIWRDDKTREGLKLRDMKRLVAGLLSQYGYPKNWIMHFVIENATATLRDAASMALAELCNQQVLVHKTMMIDGQAVWGGFCDGAKGNPQAKGWVEVTFRLMHSELGMIPGQMGRRYDEGPADLAGRTAEAKSLLTTRGLSPQQRAALRLPFASCDEARVAITDAFNRMDRREDHALEGFEFVAEWRGGELEPWRPEALFLDLTEAEKARMQWRKRLEQPMERWQRLIMANGGPGVFQRIHPSVLPAFYDNDQKEVTVYDGEIVIRRGKNEAFHYRLARIRDAVRAPKEGDKMLAYYDPESMDIVHLTDGKGAYIGSIPRTLGISPIDPVAAKAEIERRQHELKELQTRVSKRQPERITARLEDLATNIEIMSDAEAIDLGGTEGAQNVPSAAAAIQHAAATEREQQRAIDRVDTVKEQLKQNLPTPETPKWV
jgi:hypothetical protein